MKPKLDTKSLRFRLWVNFLLFTIILLAVLWLVQVVFLRSFYEGMKIRETESIAKEIETLYETNDPIKIRAGVVEIYRSNDIYIEIQTESGIPVYIPNIHFQEESSVKETESVVPLLPMSVYQSEIQKLSRELLDSNQQSISHKVKDTTLGLTTFEYASHVQIKGEEPRILFLFSPLYPIGSTLNILITQLIYVTIIAILMASIISLFLSRKVSQPLRTITESATKLGDGEYGIVFDGAHYSEIVKLADTLTYTSLELAKADNIQKDIIANVSHDLRTPLTMITSYAEMIRDISGETPEKRNAHLQVIIDEADRLNKLVSDFLDIAHMQSGKKEVNLTTFSLKEVIEGLLQSYVGFVEKEGFKLVFISKGDGIIDADEERIKQVISNLVSNAFKYCGDEKHIDVKMFDEDTYVRCEVTDFGIGIPKKDLRHIWARYYKASTNYIRSDSTGLGLSIVKEILLLHGANFGVESTVKKGSTFWFEIQKQTVRPSASNVQVVETVQASNLEVV